MRSVLIYIVAVFAFTWDFSTPLLQLRNFPQSFKLFQFQTFIFLLDTPPHQHTHTTWPLQTTVGLEQPWESQTNTTVACEGSTGLCLSRSFKTIFVIPAINSHLIAKTIFHNSVSFISRQIKLLGSNYVYLMVLEHNNNSSYESIACMKKKNKHILIQCR